MLLGSKVINVYAIRNWVGRIDNLVKHNQWDRAFALALSFYKGEARAVVGLAGSQQHKKQLVADKIIGESIMIVEGRAVVGLTGSGLQQHQKQLVADKIIDELMMIVCCYDNFIVVLR